MIQHNDGHVSLLACFRPREIRAAAAWLALFLRTIQDAVMTLDVSRGNLELGHVPGQELSLLTAQLYQRGAHHVFIRYQHEGNRAAWEVGSDQDRHAGGAPPSRAPRLN
jgi:hypothetical protein